MWIRSLSYALISQLDAGGELAVLLVDLPLVALHVGEHVLEPADLEVAQDPAEAAFVDGDPVLHEQVRTCWIAACFAAFDWGSPEPACTWSFSPPFFNIWPRNASRSQAPSSPAIRSIRSSVEYFHRSHRSRLPRSRIVSSMSSMSGPEDGVVGLLQQVDRGRGGDAGGDVAGRHLVLVADLAQAVLGRVGAVLHVAGQLGHLEEVGGGLRGAGVLVLEHRARLPRVLVVEVGARRFRQRGLPIRSAFSAICDRLLFSSVCGEMRSSIPAHQNDPGRSSPRNIT
jgi:hypothetical protein